MPTFVSLLRGINVSGKNLVKMAALRESYLDLGFKEVSTYVQSGNVVFHAPTGSLASLCESIRKKILADHGFTVSVVVRTPNELRRIIAANPFLGKKGIDPLKLHVTFLSAAPKKADVTKMDGLRVGNDEFYLSGKEIYIHCPNGYGGTKLSNNAFEKAFSVTATTRNWNTLNELLRISSRC